MIDVSLAYVRLILDQYLVSHLGGESGLVVLDNLSATNSSDSQRSRNKLAITLVNLEYETNKQFYGGMRRDGDQFSRLNPPVQFNLDVLISANFDDYVESLKFLSATIAFFQGNLAFTRSTHPAMPDGIDALKFEIENSPSQKMHNLWTALGTSYVPSIIYKIRQVAVQSGEVKGTATAVQNISASSSP